jgi:antirestriction protein
MTEEEKEEYCKACELDEQIAADNWRIEHSNLNSQGSVLSEYNKIDFLLSHHFDFRGMIPMQLAKEAPSDMYKF